MHISLMGLCNTHLPHKVGTRHFRVTIITHTHTHTHMYRSGVGGARPECDFFKERLSDVKTHGMGKGWGGGQCIFSAPLYSHTDQGVFWGVGYVQVCRVNSEMFVYCTFILIKVS